MTISFVRTLVLYFIVVIGLRIMGKRQIGELEPIELVVMIMISDLATIPMQNVGTPLLSGIVPILALFSLEILLSTLTMKSNYFRKAVIGSASILVDNGVVVQNEMRRMRLTIDELLEEMRLKGYIELSQVKYAILETNGKLSIIPFPSFEKLNRSDMGIVKEDNILPFTIVSDGKLIKSELIKSGKNTEWIKNEINKQGYKSLKEIFLMQVDSQNKVLLLPKERLV